jgi:SAM-dependent methyltransferase
MRTSSLWGTPPSRYYNFLRKVESGFRAKRLRVAILGCSDGKFVLPAARRGHFVFAIDIDGVALFGGMKNGPTGETYVSGLRERLRLEGLLNSVQVVHGDFVEYSPKIGFHAVFTSGAIQYSRNLKHPMKSIVGKVKDYTIEGGYLYIDYMLPLDDKYRGRDNYSTKREWKSFFEPTKWEVIYNRVLPPVFERAHVDNPVDHYHHWGHLLVRKSGHQRQA